MPTTSTRRGPIVTPKLGVLLDLRLRAGLTQHELARRLGSQQPRVSRREMGAPMTREMARRYADFFGVRLSKIIAR